MTDPRASVLVASGHAPSLINFRGPLLQALRSSDCGVVATSAELDEQVLPVLKTWGVRFEPIALRRAGLNPFADWRYLRGLRALMAKEQPDVVLAYTHKPVIFAALAAHGLMRKPRVYPLITGLGFAFIGRDLKSWIALQVLKWLYRRASRHFTGVFFQNPDDQALFRQLGLVRTETPQCIVRGSGIDLSAFRYEPLAASSTSHGPCFLLIARLLGDKGIREYATAARQIKATDPHAEFHLVGARDPNPAAIPPSEVDAWQREKIVIYHGALSDVRPVLRRCTVYVLPSYREGTPRTVLEAMATGRAIITTDAPGCRETVFDAGPPDLNEVRRGRNGLLVPVKSVGALVAAMRRFIDDPGLAALMGAEGRSLAERYYDVHEVNRQMMEFMALAPPPTAAGAESKVTEPR